jgi:threonine aldolase
LGEQVEEICLADAEAQGSGRQANALSGEQLAPSHLLTVPKSLSKIGMKKCGERYDFASDNTAAICPEAWKALAEVNTGHAVSYGEDPWTESVCRRIREIFETDCEVFLVCNGTAANSLALAQLCQPFDSVLCHKHAHIQTDECGAPEFFSGGAKLLLLGGADGKIDLNEAEATLTEQRELHSHKPRVVSITQATELGTVYSRDEIGRISEFARRHGMLLHMDGARFANAIAALQCAPKKITWDLGVDVLCFGGTKNGLAAGELVIFFRKELSAQFDYRTKQAGQLTSKMRFLAAPWKALLQGDVWIRNARHANQAARKLAERLRSELKIEILFPVQSNAVFLRLDDKIVHDLQERGWHFYKYLEPDIYRLMCSWSTSDELIAAFIDDVRGLRTG